MCKFKNKKQRTKSMYKKIFLLTIYLINLNFILKSMDKLDEQSYEKKSWHSLPVELKYYILSLIAQESNTTKLEDIIKSLGKAAQISQELRSLAKDLISNPETVGNLISKYIEEYPQKAAEEFIEASASGNIETAKALINNGIDINVNSKSISCQYSFKLVPVGDYEITALMAAAAFGHKDIAQLLLDKGANPNATNNIGHTSLMLAAKNGNIEIAKILLEKGARVNAQARSGFTPLTYAVMENHISMVQMLIEAGANITSEDDCGFTALHVAQWYGNHEIFKLLQESEENNNI